MILVITIMILEIMVRKTILIIIIKKKNDNNNNKNVQWLYTYIGRYENEQIIK